MPSVEVRETLHCDVATAWQQVIDVEAYPAKMTSVKQVKVLERSDLELTSEWVVTLKDSEMRWVEKEMQKPAQYRVNFYQLSGDLAMFNGYWQLHPISESETTAILLINFEIGIPALDDILNPIAIEALTDNSRRMLQSLNYASMPPVQV